MAGSNCSLGRPRMPLLPAALSVFKSRTEASCREPRCILTTCHAAYKATADTTVQDLTTHGGVRRWRGNEAMALSKTLFLG